MGIRQIIGLMTSAGVEVNQLLACGGVAAKNPFVLRAIADVTGLEVVMSESEETCALGAAVFAGVAAGAFKNTESAQSALCRVSDKPILPNQDNHARYSELFKVWTDAQTQLAASGGIVKRLQQFRAKP